MSGIHDDVLKYLPHREPFLFVDEVLNINKGSDIHAIKILDMATAGVHGQANKPAPQRGE